MHTIFIHKKHKIYNKMTQTKQQKAHKYSIVSGQFWQSTRHVVAGKIVECNGEIQLFKLLTIYQQYIISHKKFLILKIVYARPDVSFRQLPPYSNSGKVLITDNFAHAYRHATAIIQTIKLYRAHRTLSRHQLLPRDAPHVLTRQWSRDALTSASE